MQCLEKNNLRSFQEPAIQIARNKLLILSGRAFYTIGKRSLLVFRVKMLFLETDPNGNQW